mmetsp:Transcript_973/g.3073  ORF Transcript_973/g.3073 Transcript_973/m.3073 type:complete len:204 (+) Transcript_973:381-992(+)
MGGRRECRVAAMGGRLSAHRGDGRALHRVAGVRPGPSCRRVGHAWLMGDGRAPSRLPARSGLVARVLFCAVAGGRLPEHGGFYSLPQPVPTEGGARSGQALARGRVLLPRLCALLFRLPRAPPRRGAAPAARTLGRRAVGAAADPREYSGRRGRAGHTCGARASRVRARRAALRRAVHDARLVPQNCCDPPARSAWRRGDRHE